MTTPSEARRKCTECERLKPISDYYVRSNGYPHSHCKTCYKARMHARLHGPERAKVLAMNNASEAIRRKRDRNHAFAAYGGYKCVCCGETEPLFLSLDHIENDGAAFRRGAFGKRTAAGVHTYRWLKRNGYPKVVQVMCMNCQHGKRMNKGVCPHGNV